MYMPFITVVRESFLLAIALSLADYLFDIVELHYSTRKMLEGNNKNKSQKPKQQRTPIGFYGKENKEKEKESNSSS